MDDSLDFERDEGNFDPADAWLLAAMEEGGDQDAYQMARMDDDQLSFEDSERFEEDSVCSWMSEPESLNQKWRGWTSKPSGFSQADQPGPSGVGQEPPSYTEMPENRSCASGMSQPRCPSAVKPPSRVKTLAEMCARKAAKSMSFDVLEGTYQAILAQGRWTTAPDFMTTSFPTSHAHGSSYMAPHMAMEHTAIPDKLFLSIAKYSFPESEDDIRLYSCLANGNANQYTKGEVLFQANAVKELFQIGYHISAMVEQHDSINNLDMPQSYHELGHKLATDGRLDDGKMKIFDVSIKIDRCRIVSCTCSCATTSSWCQHIVAVCLTRIYRQDVVEFRTTIWDSINDLSNAKLKKFAQYLINELPSEYLPVAQRLIDQLRNPNSEINKAIGAPDPTDGGHEDVAIWCMNEKVLQENIRRILINFVKPTPSVHCDVFTLSSNHSPMSNEWQALIRPYRSKEPEPLWNLLQIVAEMFKRNDENATALLHVLTENCLCIDQILLWWYQTKLLESGRWKMSPSGRSHPLYFNITSTQYHAASLCDEIVHLWRMAALNPKLSDFEKEQLNALLQLYHKTSVTRIWKIISNMSQEQNLPYVILDKKGGRLTTENASFKRGQFPGFVAALEACQINWMNISHDFGRAIMNKVTKDLPSPFADPYDLCQNIPLLRNGCNILLSDSLGPDAFITTTNLINDITSSLRGVKPKKSKKSSHRRHKKRHATSGAHGSRRSEKKPKKNSDEISEEVDISDESPQEAGPSGSGLSKREPYEDDLDELFASAHSEHHLLSLKFSFCEALHGHGYHKEAFRLALDLAKFLYEHQPNLAQLVPELVEDRCGHKKRHSDCSGCTEKADQHNSIVQENMMNTSKLLVEHLKRTIFLIKILLNSHVKSVENPHSLALKLALTAIQNSRGPAATKFLEVQILHLETELFRLLQMIEIGIEELNFIREVASNFVDNIKNGIFNRITVPSSTLAHFIVDSLSYTYNIQKHSNNKKPSSASQILVASHRKPCDDDLALQVALESLGMRVFISEADHPMLCECIRRQRGELAMTLLLRNKDNPDKLGLILDKFLDPVVHHMYSNHESNAAYFLERDHNYNTHCAAGQRPVFPYPVHAKPTRSHRRASTSQCSAVNPPIPEFEPKLLTQTVFTSSSSIPDQVSLEQLNEQLAQLDCFASGAHESPVRPPIQRQITEDTVSTDSRDEVSSGRSTESMSISSGISRGAFYDDPGSNLSPEIQKEAVSSKGQVLPISLYSTIPSSTRSKKTPYPNQASEAQSYFMFDFAKRLVAEAGGNQASAIFNPVQNGVANTGQHRNLHICALLVGIYALGLNNKVSPTWPTRTYNLQVSFLHGEVLEIGRAALEIIRKTWDQHFTPSEVASLADRASQSGDRSVVEEAAKLALSVLPQAYALTAIENQKALRQCREHSSKLLEEACLAVEQAAEKDGVYPEVLFKVARHWYDLHEENRPLMTQNQPQIMPNSSTSYQQHQGGYSPVHFHMPPPNFNPHTLHGAYQHPQMPYATQASTGVNNYRLHMSHSAPNLHPNEHPNFRGARATLSGAQQAQQMHQQVQISMMQMMVPPPSHMPQNPAMYHNYGIAPPTRMPLPPITQASTSNASYAYQGQPMTANLNMPPPNLVPPLPLPHAFSMPGGTQGPQDQWTAFLRNAHRVGLKALDTMGSRNQDDNRSYAKYSQNPNYAEDVTWLFEISIQLGPMYVNIFCEKAASCVVSPFVLFNLAKKSTKYFGQIQAHAGYHPLPNQVVGYPQQALRQQSASHGSHASHSGQSSSGSGTVPPGHVGKGYAAQVKLIMIQQGHAHATAELMRHCVEMFFVAAYQKLTYSRFSDSDIEESIQLVKAAREAFMFIQNNSCGRSMFDAFVKYVRKQRAYKKDVKNRIDDCIQKLNQIT